MRLGLSSFAFAWAVGIPGYPVQNLFTPFDLIKFCVEKGVHLVQIADNMPLHMLSKEETQSLIELASKFNVAIEVGTRGLENVPRYIDIASIFGSQILRLVVDTSEHLPSEDEIVSSIKVYLNELERKKICLAIENHGRFTSESLARIIRCIDSQYVGICFDTANSFGVFERPLEVLNALGEVIVNVHLKDFAIKRLKHNLGYVIEGRPAGHGSLNVPEILEKLKGYGRDPNVILELWTPMEDTIEQTIKTERSWIEISIDYLRNLLPSIVSPGQG